MTERPADAPEAPLPMPTEGGSYIRNRDGSLSRVVEVPDTPPDTPPEAAPVETPAKAPKRPVKEG